jgi:hypothetical protein
VSNEGDLDAPGEPKFGAFCALRSAPSEKSRRGGGRGYLSWLTGLSPTCPASPGQLALFTEARTRLAMPITHPGVLRPFIWYLGSLKVLFFISGGIWRRWPDGESQSAL